MTTENSGGFRICQGGGDHGERAEREPKRWLSLMDQGGKAPLKLKAFCTFLHNKVAKS